MKRIDWPGCVENGKLILTDEDGFKEHLRFFSGDVEVTVRKRRRNRSTRQNKWYWGTVIDMLKDRLQEIGHDYTPLEVHEAMKWKFLKSHKDNVELPSVRSTTELSTIEFMEYTAQIQRWAAEYLKLVIPDPQEWL